MIFFFAFALGFALSRASTCTVAATKRLVRHRKADWLIGIGVAVCWSAVTLVLINALFDGITPIHGTVPISAALLLASVVMGLGAYLNNACFIGSVGRISSGELSFLATFAGLVAARSLTDQWRVGEVLAQGLMPNTLAEQATYTYGLGVLFAFGFFYGLFRLFQRRQQAMFALCAMGISAALVFSIAPDWSYEAWIGRVLGGNGLTDRFTIELAIAGLFLGATISSMRNGRFELRSPKLKPSLLCFFGGLFMGFGAKYAPGGNDTLLLWTIPNFVLYGIVSYALMVATVALAVRVQDSLRNQGS